MAARFRYHRRNSLEYRCSWRGAQQRVYRADRNHHYPSPCSEEPRVQPPTTPVYNLRAANRPIESPGPFVVWSAAVRSRPPFQTLLYPMLINCSNRFAPFLAKRIVLSRRDFVERDFLSFFFFFAPKAKVWRGLDRRSWSNGCNLTLQKCLDTRCNFLAKRISFGKYFVCDRASKIEYFVVEILIDFEKNFFVNIH